MANFEFQSPWILLLLLLLPLIIYLKYRRKKPEFALEMSSIRPFEGSESLVSRLRPLLYWLRMAALALMIIALARPRDVKSTVTPRSEQGIDIIMTVDTSLSMLAKDFKPDRLEALKEVAQRFVNERPADRIGVVDYSGEAVMRVPLTTDHKIVVDEIKKLQTGVLADGTAIGVGLATAVNHLSDSQAESKVIILITDGVESIDYSNDLLYISPRDAAQIALERGIKVYTIGIGTNGMALFPSARDMFTGELIFSYQPVELDEPMLQYIADLTGGKYFRATDNTSLEEFYEQIDQLEKSEIEQIKYYDYTEQYQPFLIWALFLLGLQLILQKTLFKEMN